MIADWIYSNPTWLWGTLLVVLAALGAGLGLIVFHRSVQVEVRKAHNELAGFIVAVISVTYAVLLAFIAVATWESFSRAQDIVDNEADYVGSIYRDTQGLPASTGQAIRDDLQTYVKTVIDDEWPVQQEGKTPTQGWVPLRKLHASIVTLQPTTMGQEVIQAELLRTLNELYSARASRLSAVEGHIPDVVWWIILFGGSLTTGFTYLFGFHDFRMHVVMTMAVAASLALVVVLIVALDWPFRGEVSIAPDAFLKTQQSWGDLPFAK
ncbi:MAG TPA: DUF4239 domain-containing protein [Candidatus Binataceae bacterium]|nr:DUF4239 domain-containing protein [Candidatus Binataceae bacterium]